MSKLEIRVGGDIGNIYDAGEVKYNSGPYFLAQLPVQVGDAYFSLLPSLLGDGWGEIAPHMGISVSGFGFGKGKFDPKEYGLPEEGYYRFLGEFISPMSLKGFSPAAVESFFPISWD